MNAASTGFWIVAGLVVLAASGVNAPQARHPGTPLGLIEASPRSVGDGTCQLRLEHVERLPGEELPGPPPISAMAQGTEDIWLSFVTGELFRFELREDGVEVHRIVRRGEGPGEFSMPLRLFPADEREFHLFDAQAGRLTRFDPDLNVVGSFVVPWRPFSAVQLDGGMVVNADIRTAEQIGLPLHWVDANGRIVQSFGLEERVRPPNEWPQWRRVMVAEGDSAFWEARDFWYHLTRWERDVATGEWFEERRFVIDSTSLLPAGYVGPPEEPPNPYLLGLSEVDEFLLVVVRTPSTDWRAALPDPDAGRPHPRMDLAYHVRLDLVDRQSGRVRATLPVEANVEAVMGDGLLLLYSEGEVFPRVEVHRARVSGCG